MKASVRSQTNLSFLFARFAALSFGFFALAAAFFWALSRS